MSRPRVVLADDDVMFMEGLRGLLAPYFDVVGMAKSGLEAVTAVEQLQPDVLVVDIFLPDLNGIRVAEMVLKRGASPKIVILTMHGDRPFVIEAFRIGASAYVLKTAAGDELVEAIQESLAGRRYVSLLVGTWRTNSIVSDRSYGR